MKKLFLPIALLVTQAASGASPLLVAERINSKTVAEVFQLTGPQLLKSGDGRKKQLWSIKGIEASSLEIIGNNQSDADQVAMSCATFDKAGKKESPVPVTSPCHRLFVRLLSKFTTTPDAFAKKLIEESAQSGVSESRRLDDLSLETDGESYFVRRLSRRGPR